MLKHTSQLIVSYPEADSISNLRPAYKAKNLLKLFLGVGIICTYILLTAISLVLWTINLVLLGTHAIPTNGTIYGRAGTAMITMISKNYGIPIA
ncbi:uncharacterized protein PGTG_13812 [Puccinia graminis f. sp. tritici CRL 75-36-700-3]|uniref:Translation initiation factor eIF2B subunit delta n=1 Tax=Puccinia graminis f. sp. tritici (strain CRL 75-36-700-3 / race SCCL) TaxID=418459 RepID=E3KUQ8_PUCGT|nr:uncharacterized protein PGTG_13812 [Puccinia graminis f. sp. tritici CRL 75-36-700-3]EFP88008.1 hypothetical protein PGTG_13812 [Puccinia graminis f. sp. tritici CRL 75-36-700-3]